MLKHEYFCERRKQVEKGCSIFGAHSPSAIYSRARSNPFNFIFNAQSAVFQASEQVEKKGRSIFRGVLH